MLGHPIYHRKVGTQESLMVLMIVCYPEVNHRHLIYLYVRQLVFWCHKNDKRKFVLIKVSSFVILLGRLVRSSFGLSSIVCTTRTDRSNN